MVTDCSVRTVRVWRSTKQFHIILDKWTRSQQRPLPLDSEVNFTNKDWGKKKKKTFCKMSHETFCLKVGFGSMHPGQTCALLLDGFLWLGWIALFQIFVKAGGKTLALFSGSALSQQINNTSSSEQSGHGGKSIVLPCCTGGTYTLDTAVVI